MGSDSSGAEVTRAARKLSTHDEEPEQVSGSRRTDVSGASGVLAARAQQELEDRRIALVRFFRIAVAGWSAREARARRDRLDRHVLPADLERVVMRCLEEHPEDRYASARELDDALAACDVPPWTHEQAGRAWEEIRPSLRFRFRSDALRAAKPTLESRQ
jgi:hypothetical protein